MKDICSSHFRKAIKCAFTKRFLRENSNFLVSESSKIYRKQSKTNLILQTLRRLFERTFENYLQSSKNDF